MIGLRNEAQLRDNIPAVALRLTDDERARLAAVSAVPLIYPYWHQHNFASDRFGPGDLALHSDFAPEQTGARDRKGIDHEHR